jgi:DNA-binding GntR family transcriptional regulator
MLKFPWVSDPSLEDKNPEQSLAQQVREEILRRILLGEIRAGQRLSEPDIAKRLGVSRVPVREALSSLQPTGLVVSKLNSGVFVRQLTPAEIHDLYEMRGLLDGHAVRLACGLGAKAKAVLIKNLGLQLDLMRDAEAQGNTLLYYQANLAFHWETVTVMRNKKFIEVYQSITQQLHLCRASNLAEGASRSASLREHQALYKAIRDGNIEAAEQAAYDHAARALKRLKNP